MHQLGGQRNFGAGVVECDLINPLYEERELKRVFDRGKTATAKMDEKDERWDSELLPEYRAALGDRIESR